VTCLEEMEERGRRQEEKKGKKNGITEKASPNAGEEVQYRVIHRYSLLTNICSNLGSADRDSRLSCPLLLMLNLGLHCSLNSVIPHISALTMSGDRLSLYR
jgi:hypothetical protein